MLPIGTICLIVRGGLEWPNYEEKYIGRCCTVVGLELDDWVPIHLPGYGNGHARRQILRPLTPPPAKMYTVTKKYEPEIA